MQRPFSISDTETVEFSPGNLVAEINGSTVSWRFATHQYDILGAYNGNYKASDATDVFYFSGVGNDFGLYNEPDPPGASCIFKDWGLNQIAYREDANYAPAGTYSTLDGPELNYLLYTRTGNKAGRIGERADCRFAGVNVEGVYGVIVFPDNFQWVRSTMGDYPKRINTYAAPDNSAYSGTQWAALEDAGVVFLPATGSRSGDIITSAGTYGRYHTGGKDADTTRTWVRNTLLLNLVDEAHYNANTTEFDSWVDAWGFYGYYQEGSSYSDLVYSEYPSGYYLQGEFFPAGVYKHTTWTYTKPDTTRNVLAFSTETFDGFGHGGIFGTTASVRLVKRPPIPNTVWPIMDPLPKTVVSVTLNNNQPVQLSIGTSANLTAVVRFDDGTTENISSVKLVDPDEIPSRYFKNNDLVSVSGGTVTGLKYGYCLVTAEYDGCRARPIVVAVADKVPNANRYYIHTSDGTRVEFAPGNLRANLASTGTTANFWFFAPTQYDYLAPPMNGSYPGAAGNTDVEHFTYSDSQSNYGLRQTTSDDGFVDWGKLSIRRSRNNSSNPYYANYWKTPSYEEWSDLLNCYNRVRKHSDGTFSRGELIEVYEINGNMCTVIVPDGLLVELPKYVGDPISSARWQELEALGCVALPHSGTHIYSEAYGSNGGGWRYRRISYAVGGEGYYWQSTRTPDGRIYPYTADDLSQYHGSTYLDEASQVYYTYLRSFGGEYNNENEMIYINNYSFWNPANASTGALSYCAVRLIRLLDKAPGY